MHKLKFHHIGFYVDRLSDARQLFEQTLGWDFDQAFTFMNEEIVFLKKKDVRVELISGEETADPLFHIAYEVLSLQPYLHNSPFPLVEGPYEIGPFRTAFFQMEGLLIELIEKRQDE